MRAPAGSREPSLSRRPVHQTTTIRSLRGCIGPSGSSQAAVRRGEAKHHVLRQQVPAHDKGHEMSSEPPPSHSARSLWARRALPEIPSLAQARVGRELRPLNGLLLALEQPLVPQLHERASCASSQSVPCVASDLTCKSAGAGTSDAVAALTGSGALAAAFEPPACARRSGNGCRAVALAEAAASGGGIYSECPLPSRRNGEGGKKPVTMRGVMAP